MSSAVERFWIKVDKSGPVSEARPDLGPCWLWTAGTTFDGYGQFGLNGRKCRAHRVSWEWENGPIAEGFELDHLCRVHGCIRPSHMEQVTRQVNQLRGYGVSGLNARKTHCAHGHALTPENTYRPPKRPERRICLTCQRRLNNRPRSRVAAKSAGTRSRFS